MAGVSGEKASLCSSLTEISEATESGLRSFKLAGARRPFSWKSSSPPATS